MVKNKVGVEILSKKFGELIFKIGKKEGTISDWKSIIEFQSFLDDFIEYTEYWNQYIYYYKDYSKDSITKFLDAQDKDRVYNYSIGENIALFTDDRLSKANNIGDNYIAAEKIKKLYENKVGKKHTLEFDPEMSFCYIYTKNRSEAEVFLWWIYTDIIKPVLDEIQH